jgi:GT2 family glycosyltransferase
MPDEQLQSLAIITVTFNSGCVIKEFLDSLIAQTYLNWQLYVIDNSSTDNTLALIQTYNDQRIIVIVQPNHGFATSTNLGIKTAIKANHDLFLLLNNDTAFEAAFLAKLLAVAAHQKADIIAPHIIQCNGPAELSYSGQNFHKYLNYKPVKSNTPNISHYCTFAPMCCTLITKHAFMLNGFLDEQYFVYVEDIDWFFRAMQLKLKLWYTTEAAIYHQCSALTGRNSKFSEFYGKKGLVYFLKKHFSLTRRCSFLLMQLAVIFFFFLVGRYGIKTVGWRLSGYIAGLKQPVVK